VSRVAPRPLSHALDGLTAALLPPGALGRVQAVWETTAGPAIAAAAQPTGERDGTLTVTCSAAVWAQELELVGSTLVQRLNEALGEPLLRRLRCRVQ
jgi:predicted nucleic acid-binding Zn ribbon protein